MSDSYKYDVFLSWTGKDRLEKNIVRDYLVANNLSVYDSDLECKGTWRDDCLDSLDVSKVYLLFLSKSIDREDFVSCVVDEFSRFCKLSQNKHINVIILDLDSYFNERHPESETWKWFNNRNEIYETSHIRMYGERYDSFKDAFEEVKELILKHINSFIHAREIGKPIIHRVLDLGINYDLTFHKNTIIDREDIIEGINNAFKDGKKNIILYGPGGIGKTSIINKLIDSNKDDYIQTVFISSDTQKNSQNKVEMVLSNIQYRDSEMYKLASMQKNMQINYQKQILSKLPDTQFIIVDNIDDLNSDDIEAISKLFPCHVVFTTRSTVDFGSYEVFKIGSLAEEDCKKVFLTVSEKEISGEAFHDLYTQYNGNTMIISMIATLYKKHEDFSLEKSLFSFSHNEFSSVAKLSDQLKLIFAAAYNTNNIDLNQVLLLLNMSLLSNYEISLDDLYKYLKSMDKYDIDNAIDMLEKCGGWIDLEDGVVSIDRNISNCIREILLEKYFENDKEKMRNECIHLDLTNYVIDKSYKARIYTDILREQGSVYFALKNYVMINSELDVDLFERYVRLSEDLKIEKYIISQLVDLENYIDSPYDKAKVITYESLMQIRLNPLSDEWFDKFSKNLIYCSNYEHKWIIKILSISAEYFSYYSIRKSLMLKCLDNAWNVLYSEVEKDKSNQGDKELFEGYVAELLVFLNHYILLDNEKGKQKVFKLGKELNKKYDLDNYLILKLYKYYPLKKIIKALNEGKNIDDLRFGFVKNIQINLFAKKLIERDAKNPFLKSFKRMVLNSIEGMNLYELLVAFYEMLTYMKNNDLTLVSDDQVMGGMLSIVTRLLSNENGIVNNNRAIATFVEDLKKDDKLKGELSDISLLSVESRAMLLIHSSEAYNKTAQLLFFKSNYFYGNHPTVIDSMIDCINASTFCPKVEIEFINFVFRVAVANRERQYKQDGLLYFLISHMRVLLSVSIMILKSLIDNLKDEKSRNDLLIMFYGKLCSMNEKKRINLIDLNELKKGDPRTAYYELLKNLDSEIIKLINNKNYAITSVDSLKSIITLTRLTVVGTSDYSIEIIKAVSRKIKRCKTRILGAAKWLKPFYLMQCNVMIDKLEGKKDITSLNKQYLSIIDLAIKQQKNNWLVSVLCNWIGIFKDATELIDVNKINNHFEAYQLEILKEIISNISYIYKYSSLYAVREGFFDRNQSIIDNIVKYLLGLAKTTDYSEESIIFTKVMLKEYPKCKFDRFFEFSDKKEENERIMSSLDDQIYDSNNNLYIKMDPSDFVIKVLDNDLYGHCVMYLDGFKHIYFVLNDGKIAEVEYAHLFLSLFFNLVFEIDKTDYWRSLICGFIYDHISELSIDKPISGYSALFADYPFIYEIFDIDSLNLSKDAVVDDDFVTAICGKIVDYYDEVASKDTFIEGYLRGLGSHKLYDKKVQRNIAIECLKYLNKKYYSKE